MGGTSRPPPRDVAAAAERLLIVGLDEATFDVLDPLMDAGRLPRLKEAIASGVSGVLRSTMPPIVDTERVGLT